MFSLKTIILMANNTVLSGRELYGAGPNTIEEGPETFLFGVEAVFVDLYGNPFVTWSGLNKNTYLPFLYNVTGVA